MLEPSSNAPKWLASVYPELKTKARPSAAKADIFNFRHRGFGEAGEKKRGAW